MATGWDRDHVSRGITQRWKIPAVAFKKNYDPSVLRRVTYLMYEIKWRNNRRRKWRKWRNRQKWFCTTRNEHAEMHFLNDVLRRLWSDPSVHCSITCYMSWSPCGLCCQKIMNFLKEMPNVNLVIYVARLYWHRNKYNRQGLWNLANFGVTIRVMDLPAYRYCWRTFVDDEDKDEDDYWPTHLTPWIMLYSLELQSILQNSPSCLKISKVKNWIPIFSLYVEDDQQKKLLTSAST
ncbi:C-_U-editing enzyme APOBEC-1-like [Emydura macquarii macquarii]|uniref:C->U-editing enzyme APOBEC-1-like n=1 Tax=Emydura macquarii macquarii TaxID=1129001 RepID=UPI00352B939A